MSYSPIHRQKRRRLLPVLLLGAPWLLGVGLLAGAEQAVKDGLLTRWLLESCGAGAAPALVEAPKAPQPQTFSVGGLADFDVALVVDVRHPRFTSADPEVDCEVDVQEIRAHARRIGVEAREQALVLASAATPHTYRFTAAKTRNDGRLGDQNDWIMLGTDLPQ